MALFWYRWVARLLMNAPYYVLCFFPFMDRLRVKKRTLVLVTAVTLVLHATLITSFITFWPRAYNSLVYFLLYYLVCTVEYKLAFRISFGKLLYAFLLVYAFANVPTELAGELYLLLRPTGSVALVPPEYLLCYLLTHALLVPPFALLLRRVTGPAFRAIPDRAFWPLNLLPLLFLVLNMLFGTVLEQTDESPLLRVLLFLTLSLTGLAVHFVTLRMLVSTGERERLRAERESMEAQLALQAQGYESLARRVEDARTARHDVRHHLNAIRNFAAKGDNAGLLRYLDGYEGTLPRDAPDWCENQPVNALLRHYLAQAAEAGVRLDVKLDLPWQAGIPDADLCVVFGNIFENAARSAAQAGQGAYLRARCETGDAQVVLTVENSEGGNDVHGEGLGLKSVAAVAEKHGGAVRFLREEGVYHSQVLLRKGRQAT